MASPIYFFTKNDRYFELSNFYPQGFEEDGVYWPSVEHYFQAMKFESREHREKVRCVVSAKQAKTLGQSRKYTIKRNWDDIREDVMKHALTKKFEHPKLKELLLGTKNRELVENSPYDRYWGCGRDGKGKNRLGKLLMEVRDDKRAGT